MALLKRFQTVRRQYEHMKSLGVDPFGIKMEKLLSPTEAIINGRKTILIGTNNYLGLTFDPRCQAASAETAYLSGTGTTGSRIANGSYAEHTTLESDLADFYGKKQAMVFSTGYQANLGIISTIAGPDDFLLLDADSHASIYDGAKLGTATVIRFRHNDPNDLDRRLNALQDKPGNKIIVLEGIYSMLGDKAPLTDFVAVKKKYANAYIVLDEAHSMGVLGQTGRGLCQEENVEADIDFIVGTFSKSLGAVGGFCVSDSPEFDLLRLVCRPYMFTASLPPATIASVKTALRIIQQEPQLRYRLWQNVEFFYNQLAQLGFRLGKNKSPVVPIYLPNVEVGTLFWQNLLKNGVYANIVMPPATPMGTVLLRCSICSAHERQQLQKVVDILKKTAEEVGYFAIHTQQKFAVA
ncbi:MAG: aminotransferase class I/II-fold pyridoxal phosphate-dependent enzyme [Alphaproteobacteria bacterium]|nr:aminotransferase class I/II-fold pyridoxal phosphate-dependent enzyme [Alphaproteobacteria bacterium]